MQRLPRFPVLLILLLGGLTLPGPVQAQDTSGWLYVARGGDIIAMRPDGSGAVNLTQTPDIVEDEPDVSNASGRTLYVHATRTSDGQQAIRDYNLVSGGFFENIPFQSIDIGDPSHGVDDTFLYLHNRQREIVRVNVFEGTQETVVDSSSFEFVYHVDGSPTATNGFAYVAEVAGISAVRVNDRDVPQDGAVGAENYSSATYPSYAPDGSFVVFSCTSGGASFQLCRTDTEPGGSSQIIPTPTDAVAPVVSPQGDRVAWRDRSGNVWVAGIDGSNPTQIANGDNGEDYGLEWGPDIPLVNAPPAEDPPPPSEPDPAPNTPLPPGGTDGDPATTDRAQFSSPVPYAAAVSQARFSAAAAASAFAGEEGAQAQYAVLSRDDNFADSLAGSPLTANGPLLYSSTASLSQETAEELQRVVPPGGTVYLLGGEAALSAQVEQAVRDLGFDPVRLSGPSRFETAVAVAREVIELGGSTRELLLARGTGPADNPTAAWADSVTGGVYAAGEFVPVVVTPTGDVHPAVDDLLAETGAEAVILGGTAAISQAVEDSLKAPRRVAGDSRADTAGQIATQLLDFDVDGPRTVLLFDGFAENGWTFGLAAAGLTADLHAALLMVSAQDVPPQTAALIGSCGEPQVETLILGWEELISPDVVAEVDRLDGDACN